MYTLEKINFQLFWILTSGIGVTKDFVCPWLENSGQFFPLVILTVEYTKAISFTMLLQGWFKKRRAKYRKYQQTQMLQCASADGQDTLQESFWRSPEASSCSGPSEDRIFRCHWQLIMPVKPYPFSNKELCIQNTSCPFWGSVRCACQLLRKYLPEEKEREQTLSHLYWSTRHECFSRATAILIQTYILLSCHIVLSSP